MRASTTSSFTWSPVIDGTFLPYSLASATSRNKINGDNVFAMFNRFEGSSFVSSGYNTATNGTDASFTKWVHAFLPDVTDATLEKIRELYPDIGEGNDEYTTVQDRAGFAYRDIVLTCPGYWLASSASQKKGKGKGYVGEYVISPAKHASDTGYVRFRMQVSSLDFTLTGLLRYTVEQDWYTTDHITHHISWVCRSFCKLHPER